MDESKLNDGSTRRVHVRRKVTEASGIASFELVDPDGAELPAFTAGAHIDVHLPNGLVRQYSLCSDPHDRTHYQVCVLRELNSRGGSQAMHDIVDEGTSLVVGAPRNLFQLVEGARRSVLIAGGIGITPLLSMARQLIADDADFVLHYVARTREHASFHRTLAQRPFERHVAFHFTGTTGGRRPDLDALVGAPDSAAHLYVCGPSGFIDAVMAAARRRGWADQHLHTEFFGKSEQGGGLSITFQVRIASTGRVYVIEADTSVTTTLAEHGIEIPVSCEQGICGTCLTRVLDGLPEHRDQYLSPEEHALNDRFTPCCSRARSACLTLDL